MKKFSSIVSAVVTLAIGTCVLTTDNKKADASSTYNIGYAAGANCFNYPGLETTPTTNSYGQLATNGIGAENFAVLCPIPMDQALTYNTVTARFWNGGGSTYGYALLTVEDATTGASTSAPVDYDFIDNNSEGVQTAYVDIGSSYVTNGDMIWLWVQFSGPMIFVGYTVNHN